jgi:hypothetical protein
MIVVFLAVVLGGVVTPILLCWVLEKMGWW